MRPLTRREIFVFAALVGAAGCRDASDTPPGAVAGQRLRAILVEASKTTATTAGEIGVVASARMSPAGRWIVVVDRSPPHVKLIDSVGSVHPIVFSRDSSPPSLTPTAAVSNTALLVMWPDSNDAAVYDLTGKIVAPIRVLGFAPLSAIALSDTTWMVYGPSDAKVNGMAKWVHCLTVHRGGRVAWADGFADSLRLPLEAYWRGVPTTVDGLVTIDHIANRSRSMRLSARCAAADAPPSVSVAAVNGRDRVWFELPSSSADATTKTATRFVSVYQANVLTKSASSVRSRRAQPSTVFQPTDGRRIVVPGRFTLLDASPARGLLFATTDGIPKLFVVRSSTVASVISNSQ